MIKLEICPDDLAIPIKDIANMLLDRARALSTPSLPYPHPTHHPDLEGFNILYQYTKNKYGMCVVLTWSDETTGVLATLVASTIDLADANSNPKANSATASP